MIKTPLSNLVFEHLKLSWIHEKKISWIKSPRKQDDGKKASQSLPIKYKKNKLKKKILTLLIMIIQYR